jgi:hypothetical protein
MFEEIANIKIATQIDPFLYRNLSGKLAAAAAAASHREGNKST